LIIADGQVFQYKHVSARGGRIAKFQFHLPRPAGPVDAVVCQQALDARLNMLRALDGFFRAIGEETG